MIRDTHCDAEIVGPAKSSGKSLVLNRQKWNKILQNLHRGEKEQEMSEKELRYKEYLKEESRAMTRKWENSVEKARDQKTADKLRREQTKAVEGELRFKALKENDENKRIQLVNEAKGSLQRLKCGVRQIETAYALSEILQSREIQCEHNAKELKFRKDRDLADAEEHIAQEDQWNDIECEKMITAKKRKDVYKKQLLEHIHENDLRQKENTKKANEQIRQEREAADRDLQMQLERERVILQKKKEAMRKNALEAMRIAEQRRLRVKMENEIENKIISIFSKKSGGDEVKKESDNKMAMEKERLRHLIAQKIFDEAEAKQKAEQESYVKSVQDNEIKFSKLEQSKVEHTKKLKAARIQQYIDDLERKKKLENQKIELRQWDVANRFKNDQVNIDYDRTKRLHEMKKVQGHRQALQKQIDEKKQRRPPEYVDESLGDNAEDDQHFFKCANELIEEAKAKNRNLYPLIKAVEAYKKTNNLQNLKDEIPCLQQSNGDGLAATPIKYNIIELKKMNNAGSVPKRCASTCAPPLKLNNNDYYRNFNNSCK